MQTEIIPNEHVIMGSFCQIDEMARVGGPPQIRSPHNSQPYQIPEENSTNVRLVIGDNVTIREFAAVHKGSTGTTTVGTNSYLMCHTMVNHDCELRQNVTLCSGAVLGGHVFIGEGTCLGQNSSVHQHVVVGAYCMIAMGAAITKHVPPFLICFPHTVCRRVNYLGLRRAGFCHEDICQITQFYKKHGTSAPYCTASFWRSKCPVEQFADIAVRDFCNAVAERGSDVVHPRMTATIRIEGDVFADTDSDTISSPSQ